MPNHPNRNWRRRWTVDLETRTATHQTGFAVVFRRDAKGWIHERVINEAVVHRLDVARMIEQATDLFTKATIAAAIRDGRRAFVNGISENPHDHTSELRRFWDHGWRAQRDDYLKGEVDE